MITTEPPPRRCISGNAARVGRTTPIMFRSQDACHSSSVIPTNPVGRGVAPPTLLIRMSIPPRAAAAAISSSAPGGRDRSTDTYVTWPASSIASRSLPGVRDPATT
ncbi:hypothetical protein A9W98_00660 [Mycobacterium gordonae]|uniref:Uncharacterized protein n=1 Tax=Mycobacterium gordonae TaxID=1778 RepID=A0A1A6BMV7_MYCGO|nr:hypothetical protein A9W98_00660 [Mycobacterium gordonae]